MVILLLMGVIMPINIMILYAPDAEGVTWFVDDDGGKDFTSIQDAINWSSPGDFIYVYPGTYNERLTISKSLNLRGAKFGADPTSAGLRENASQESIITEAGLPDPNPNVLIDIANSVTDMFIDGFTLIGDPTDSNADTCAVRYGGSSGLTYNISIRNNIIEGRYGIVFRGGDNLDVLNNRITANKNCMVVQMNTATNVTISNNRFRLGSNPQGDESAIYVTACSDSIVSGNNATGFINGKGIAASASNNLTISDNIFYKNKDAISFWGGSTYITIHNNILNDSIRFGINMKGQDINITNNTITDNTGHGIHIDKHVIDTLRVNIHNNNISSNTGDGVNVSSAQDTINASDNWWGDDSGPGGAGSGTGDNISSGVTYRPWIESEVPVPDAGENQTVNQTETVFFNASGSTDNQGISNYTWTFNDNGTWELYGVAPNHTFNDAGTFNVSLNVTDDVGNWALGSMVVTVNDIINPIANAGSDRIVDQGTIVTFNGSGSSDIVGIVNYTWTFTDLSPKTLYEAEPSYTFANAGIFIVMLNVTDAALNYHTDNMTVTVNDNTNPIANAGQNRSVDQHENITFNGSGSSDNVAIVNYNWTFDDGGSQTLNSVTPWYVFDNAGTFNITLNVTDDAGNWHNDNMTVTVNDTTNPLGNAGGDRTIDQHENLTFDGSGSSDNEAFLYYNWTFDDAGSQTLNGINPWYVFHNAGEFLVTLNVTDDAENWHNDNMTVTVNDTTNPIANAGPNRNVDQHENITFNGSGSSDNVAIVNYSWTFNDVGSQTLNGINPWYVFDNAGIFNITLNVTDGAGNWHNDTIIVVVNDTEKPNLMIDNSPNSGTTGDNFQFNISVSDNMNIDTVFVNWTHGNLGGNISLAEINGYWTATVRLDGDLGDLTYYIYINDTSNNYNISNLQTVSVSDNDLPSLMTDHTPDNGTTGDDFRFNISASDNIDIDTVHVNWTHGDLGGNISLAETNGYWISTIQLDSDLDDLAYYIYINDTSNNYNISNLQTVSVSDNDLPSLVTDHTSDNGTTGDDFHFNISASDNIDVDTVYVNWSHGSLGSNVSLAETNGYWIAMIRLDDDLGNLFYRTDIRDTSGNNNVSSLQIVTVGDNDLPIFGLVWNSALTTGDPAVFSINITDNIALHTVMFNFSMDGVDNYSWAVINNSGSSWSINITIPHDSASIEYYFRTIDTSGNINGTMGATLDIADNDLPELVEDLTQITPTTGDPCTILIHAWDNIGVTNMSVNYTFDGITYQNESLSPDNDGLWNLTVIVPENGVFLRYRLYISDKAGNILNTSRPQKAIQDNDVPTFLNATLEEPRTGVTSNVSVDAADNMAVSSIYVKYTFNGVDYFQDPLIKKSGNTWNGSIMIIINATFLNYSFIVTDGADNELDTVLTIGENLVNVSDIIKPTVMAGADLFIDQNTEVTFDGGECTDNVGITNYSWSFVYDGSEYNLYGLEVSHLFHIPGSYLITLKVSDAENNWNTDTILLRVLDITPPIAVAQIDAKLELNAVAHFNGSGSWDNVGVINWTWSFPYGQNIVELYGKNVTFTFRITGEFRINLRVADEAGLFDTVTVLVDVYERTNIKVLPEEILEADLKDEYGNVVARVKVSGNGTLDVKRLEWSDLADEMGELPNGKQHIGIFVEITIDELDWIYIEIPYDESDLPEGMEEQSLRLFFWNVTSGQWEEVEGSNVDTDANFVWANVTHLTIFGPMASEMEAAPVEDGDLSITTWMWIGIITILIILMMTFAILFLKEKKRGKKEEAATVEEGEEGEKMESEEVEKDRCPDCDSEMNEEDKLCPNCGFDFEEEDEEEEVVCPECGGELDGDVDICPDCGIRLKAKAKEAEDKSKEAFTEAREGEQVCPECWEDVEEGDEVCSHCGRSLEVEIETTEEDGPMCPDCGGAKAADDKVCPHCTGISETGDICPQCSSICEEGETDCPVCGHEFEEWYEDMEKIENELDQLMDGLEEGVEDKEEEEEEEEEEEGAGDVGGEEDSDTGPAESEIIKESDNIVQKTPMEEKEEELENDKEEEEEEEGSEEEWDESDPDETDDSAVEELEFFEYEYKCPECSSILKTDASFCPYCGMRFESEETMDAKEDPDEVVERKKGRYVEPDEDYDFEMIFSPYEDAEIEIDLKQRLHPP